MLNKLITYLETPQKTTLPGTGVLPKMPADEVAAWKSLAILFETQAELFIRHPAPILKIAENGALLLQNEAAVRILRVNIGEFQLLGLFDLTTEDLKTIEAESPLLFHLKMEEIPYAVLVNRNSDRTLTIYTFKLDSQVESAFLEVGKKQHAGYLRTYIQSLGQLHSTIDAITATSESGLLEAIAPELTQIFGADFDTLSFVELSDDDGTLNGTPRHRKQLTTPSSKFTPQFHKGTTLAFPDEDLATHRLIMRGDIHFSVIETDLIENTKNRFGQEILDKILGSASDALELSRETGVDEAKIRALKEGIKSNIRIMFKVGGKAYFLILASKKEIALSRLARRQKAILDTMIGKVKIFLLRQDEIEKIEALKDRLALELKEILQLKSQLDKEIAFRNDTEIVAKSVMLTRANMGVFEITEPGYVDARFFRLSKLQQLIKENVLEYVDTELEVRRKQKAGEPIMVRLKQKIDRPRIDQLRKTMRLSTLDEQLLKQAHADHFHLDIFRRSPSILSGDHVFSYVRSNGNLLVCLADFTGHGTGAAMAAVSVADKFYRMARAGESIETIAREINFLIYDDYATGMSLAGSFLEVDLAEKELTITNAGIPECFIVRGSSVLATIKSKNLPLGMIDFLPITFEKHRLQAGDTVHLTTDGLPDEQGQGNVAFGEERLKEVLTSNAAPPQENLSALAQTRFAKAVARINQHLGTTVPSDDLTLIGITVI